MKISVGRLLSEAIAVELPRAAGAPNRLELTRGVNVRGTYSDDDGAISLEKLGADVLDAREVVLHLGSAVISCAVTLQGLAADLRFARDGVKPGFTARGISKQISAKSLVFDAGAVHVQAASIAIEVAECGDDGSALSVELGSIIVTNLRVRVSTVSISIGQLAAANVRVSKSASSTLEIGASSLELTGVRVASEGADITLDKVAFPEGLVWAGSALRANRVVVGESDVTIRERLSAAKAPAGPNAAPQPESAMDWTVLDGLNGEVDVDLIVDAKIPVIGKLSATHHFRVPVSGGTIDYKKVEHELPLVEDAVLDFKLKADRLIFEKDVPLIPFDNQTLVYWPLDAEEHALAARHIVRLRRLIQPQVPPPAGSGKPSPFQLLRIDLNVLDVALRLDGTHTVTLSPGLTLKLGKTSGDAPAIESFRVIGAIHYVPNQEPLPGELKVSMENAYASECQLPVGGGLRLAGAEIGAIEELKVAFKGLRPASAAGRIRAVDVRGVALAFRP